MIRLLFALTLAGCSSPALMSGTTTTTFAASALGAWEQGESGRGYDAFRALLSPTFRTFSHPFAGRASGPAAREALLALVAEREQTPNALAFSNAEFYPRGREVAVLFDSRGTVGESIPYDGAVVIVFEFERGQIVGFREFLGRVDPAWFSGAEPRSAGDTVYEMLVGLQVLDDDGYEAYRRAMTPVLASYGGGFGVDLRVAEVLRSPSAAPFDRVFTVHFPDQVASDAFFADPDYARAKSAHFEASVGATTILTTYTRQATAGS